jgi:hypothetical protein
MTGDVMPRLGDTEAAAVALVVGVRTSDKSIRMPIIDRICLLVEMSVERPRNDDTVSPLLTELIASQMVKTAVRRCFCAA